jgi:hypothetical protein
MGFTSDDRAKFTDSRLPDVVSSSLRISRPHHSHSLITAVTGATQGS